MPEPKKTEINLHEAYKPKRGPKAIIDFFFLKVNFIESLFVVLSAVILNVLIFWLMKGQNLADYSIYQFYYTILINWILLGVIVFLIMYFIRGQKNLPKKPFEKVLSSIASFRVTAIIYSVLCTVIVIVFFPALISIIQATAVNPALIDSLTIIPKLTIFNIIGIVLLFLFTIYMLIYWIRMLYEFTEIVFDIKGGFSKFMLMLLLFVIVILINLL